MAAPRPLLTKRQRERLEYLIEDHRARGHNTQADVTKLDVVKYVSRLIQNERRRQEKKQQATFEKYLQVGRVNVD